MLSIATSIVRDEQRGGGGATCTRGNEVAREEEGKKRGERVGSVLEVNQRKEMNFY